MAFHVSGNQGPHFQQARKAAKGCLALPREDPASLPFVSVTQNGVPVYPQVMAIYCREHDNQTAEQTVDGFKPRCHMVV